MNTNWNDPKIWHNLINKNFSGQTQINLRNAVTQSNIAHILTYSGSFPRQILGDREREILNLQATINELEIKIKELQNELNNQNGGGNLDNNNQVINDLTIKLDKANELLKNAYAIKKATTDFDGKLLSYFGDRNQSTIQL